MSDAVARLAEVVDSARVGHDPVYLTRRGQRVAAVIDADDLDEVRDEVLLILVVAAEHGSAVCRTAETGTMAAPCGLPRTYMRLDSPDAPASTSSRGPGGCG